MKRRQFIKALLAAPVVATLAGTARGSKAVITELLAPAPKGNNLASGTTRKLAAIFLKEFEATRVLEKANSKISFPAAPGDTITIKRPVGYPSDETTRSVADEM